MLCPTALLTGRRPTPLNRSEAIGMQQIAESTVCRSVKQDHPPLELPGQDLDEQRSPRTL